MGTLRELEGQDFIRPSRSVYVALVMFVAKKDGLFWLYVDYQALNKQIIKNEYPLPLQDYLLIHYWDPSTSCIKIDLCRGYYQIRNPNGLKHLTMIRIGFGSYEFSSDAILVDKHPRYLHDHDEP